MEDDIELQNNLAQAIASSMIDSSHQGGVVVEDYSTLDPFVDTSVDEIGRDSKNVSHLSLKLTVRSPRNRAKQLHSSNMPDLADVDLKSPPAIVNFKNKEIDLASSILDRDHNNLTRLRGSRSLKALKTTSKKR